ncbi:hydroxyacid dehydrogenase [Fervidobacterium pennivorans subsp. shakshaketiis]|jgi:D-3-phosphoglycerate dehydrogenase|uniref:Phosphoglycerate dehydrogenase-like oxidoreductase n=1 Tax=Fervidobacterium pennivorans (strain DSM 9078 / Ven5) TaxID=771875 RepID=H9UAD9_FERPD|nr:hydroxyacid dehydrogenase [Fervidobacterium pennivorans]AFG34482.1 phosphoglycerate dehydrogenase-like oxidoreductase [Fervidobacterium pennivorans DSM 9078]QIV77819.1 3-phosphoglycerate dehydrogenase [Fervidobacterium pennivorans subsp. keratinolyticus]
MRIHINDPLDKQATERLKSVPGVELTSEHLEKEELLKIMPEIEVLIVRSATKVTADIIEAGTKLKIIGRAGTGLDNIDVKAAEAKGIKVINTPGANSISVAELTIGLMIACSRHIARGTIDLKNGKWTKKELEGHELFGRTVGIIGFGNIGREVAKRLLAFDMKILAYDPFVKETDMNVKMVDLDTLYKESDYITIHVPLTPETKNLINKETFSKMKDGVIIINAARGGIIDEAALYEALVNGKVYAAGLDVFEVEPPTDELRQKLLALPNVVATPHIGASTFEAQERVGMLLVERLIKEIA